MPSYTDPDELLKYLRPAQNVDPAALATGEVPVLPGEPMVLPESTIYGKAPAPAVQSIGMAFPAATVEGSMERGKALLAAKKAPASVPDAAPASGGPVPVAVRKALVPTFGLDDIAGPQEMTPEEKADSLRRSKGNELLAHIGMAMGSTNPGRQALYASLLRKSQEQAAAPEDRAKAVQEFMLRKYGLQQKAKAEADEAAWRQTQREMAANNVDYKRDYLELQRLQMAANAGDKAAQRALQEKIATMGNAVDWAKIANQRNDLADKQNERATKQTREDEEINIPGLELQKGSRPTPQQKTDAAKTKATLDTVDRSIGTLLDLYKRYGPQARLSDVRSVVDTVSGDLQLMLKGPEQYQLGVIAGPDQDFLDKVSSTPTGFEGTLKDWLGDNPEMRLKTLQAQVRNRSSDRIKAAGYRPPFEPQGVPLASPPPAGGPPPAAPPKTPSGKPFAKKQYSDSQKKTRFLDAAGNVIEVVDGRA